MRGKTPKKPKTYFKKQRNYHSSSEDEGGARDAPEDAEESSEDEATNSKSRKPQSKVKAKIPVKKLHQEAEDEEAANEDGGSEDAEDQDDSDDDDLEADEFDLSDSDLSETSTNNPRKMRKRNDPDAFAMSISKILGTKLTSQKRSEPILSRSKAAQETHKSLADHKLTVKAQRALLAEKKAAQGKGRIRDVLGLETENVSTADIIAEEKKLRKTAQKGVIKLFNAVRAAQVKAEQAEKESRQKGVVGIAQREDKVKEMSKQGFLDMIAGGGKKKEGSVEA